MQKVTWKLYQPHYNDHQLRIALIVTKAFAGHPPEKTGKHYSRGEWMKIYFDHEVVWPLVQVI